MVNMRRAIENTVLIDEKAYKVDTAILDLSSQYLTNLPDELLRFRALKVN